MVHVTNARGTGSCLTALMTRTGRKPSGTETATSLPPIGTLIRLTYSEFAKCTATSDGPGGKLVSVTRPSPSVVPRQFVVFSDSAIRDGEPRPIKRTADGDAGLSGRADTPTLLRGPIGEETRNVALPVTTIRVEMVPVPDAATVRATESGC